MKIHFPLFKKRNVSHQTITQACRNMEAISNRKSSLKLNNGPRTSDYISFLNRETHNKSWFKKMCESIQILFGKE